MDDKLIRAANDLGEDVPAVAERFINAYFEDVEAALSMFSIPESFIKKHK
ncbi:hypothetical protein P6709_19840 [Jeotgalibacillus sp. ET6]|nr:hypothetical protein [Jeotgalibacillus sp. ET6]MDG5473965.1 hypothetical protein [Jeotgalibacillus sp. ET6]